MTAPSTPGGVASVAVAERAGRDIGPAAGRESGIVDRHDLKACSRATMCCNSSRRRRPRSRWRVRVTRQSLPMRCEDVVLPSGFPIPNIVIKSTTLQARPGNLPKHCQVDGAINERSVWTASPTPSISACACPRPGTSGSTWEAAAARTVRSSIPRRFYRKASRRSDGLGA